MVTSKTGASSAPAKPAAARSSKKSTPAKAEASATDVLKVMELARGSDSVELKLSIPAAGHAATIKALKLDPVEAQPRQAYFFDTPQLDLYKAGLVVRARRIQGGRADTVIKLRPINPADIDTDLRRSASFKVEVDLMPGGFVCSGSFKGVCTGKEVLDVTLGAMPLSSLFSKGQRAFFATHAPAGFSLDALSVLGPTFLLKAKHQPKDFPRPITVEMWLYPDGSRILEVSTKCLPADTFQTIFEFKAFLQQCGIAISEIQETKTKTSLEFYSRLLATQAAS